MTEERLLLTPTTPTTKDGIVVSDGSYPQTQADYERMGWRTFPVKANEKTPLETYWQNGGPVPAGANIGLVTGLPSGVVVLDVDDRHGGWQSLADMEEIHGKLPETLRSTTANGGAHFFFKHPGNREVRNGQRIYGRPGLDIRGDGGYVVVPPSSIDSRNYFWDIGSPLSLADAPLWVVTHGENRVREVELGPDTKNPPGTHHDYLLRVAGSLRHFGTPQDVLERMLLDLNQAKNEPPCPESEVLALAKDAAKRYKQGHKPQEQPKTLSVPASEFINLETKPFNWLVQGVWPEEAIGFIAGMGKSFKSFLALELGYSIASGALFLERFKVPEPRKVLLVQQESSFGAFQVRVNNLVKRFGATDNLYIISNKHLSLEASADVERLENEIRRVQPVMVILDPLASFIHGDENSNQAMGEVVATLRRLRDDYGCAICVVHHNRKDGTAMRGATALFNAHEVFIKMQRTADRESLTSTVEMELKEHEGPYPFNVTLDSETTALRIGEADRPVVEATPEPYLPEDIEQAALPYYNQEGDDEDERFSYSRS